MVESMQIFSAAIYATAYAIHFLSSQASVIALEGALKIQPGNGTSESMLMPKRAPIKATFITFAFCKH